jgi:hypothetical protein
MLLSAREYHVYRLKGHSINQLKLAVDSNLLIQGTTHKIGLTAFDDNGNPLTTRGLLKGKLYWSNFIVELKNAEYRNGEIKILKTDIDNYRDFIPFRISSKYEPEKVFSDTLWLNYEKSIHLFPVNNFKKVPGANVKFGLQVTYDNDKSLIYRYSTQLKKAMNNYAVLVKGVSFDDDEFTISSNIFDNPDHNPGIYVELKRNPDIFDTLNIQLDYRDNFRVQAQGGSGMWGFSGFSGSNASTNNIGGHGQDGEHGRDAQNGSDMDIYTDIYYDSILGQKLIKIHSVNLATNNHNYYLVNPYGGSFQVNAWGGNGGSGGNGGDGGKGGDGRVGDIYYECVKEIITKKDTAGKEYKVEIIHKIQRQKPGENGASGGEGGFGGVGGNGGAGGYVMVFYTDEMKNYLDKISANVSGGVGGEGGRGGSGGRGGNGGKGSPNGREGNRGRNGLNGPYGYNGPNGRIEFQLVDKIPW